MLPGFLDGPGFDVLAEWAGFQAARPNEAADTLALLGEIGLWGPDHVRAADRLDPVGLYGHAAQDWKVFYTIAGPFNGPWRVTVLSVALAGVLPGGTVAQEAIRRRGLYLGQGRTR